MGTEKFDFSELTHIVMEGGGARGAAYLGAVRALEKKMEERKTEPHFCIHSIGARGKPGLLDYYSDKNDKEKPIIEGIAGSSAGAITTFALALGFNSKEIENILDYDFKNFLKEIDAGRYRMIDENGKLAVGEDKKNKITQQKELAKHGDFVFKFDANRTSVNGNPIKRGFRNLVVSIGIKTLVDGIGSNINQLTGLEAKLKKVTNGISLPPFWLKLFGWLVNPKNVFLKRLGWYKLGQLLFFKVYVPKVMKAPMKFDADTVGNLFFDRGMFSGFAVREFFMDMLLMALTKETAFHRGFLEFLKSKNSTVFSDETIKKMSKDLLDISNFEIGKRSQSKINNSLNFDSYKDYLAKVTFKDLYDIIGVDFVVCVSNFTSGFPLYFGKDYTPNFLVMEAVSASMTIPPAIKPLYNVSDVVTTEALKPEPLPFFKDGKFNLAEYYLQEHIVKLFLAQEKAKKKVFIDVNNSIDMSAFLSPLKGFVIGEIDEETGVFKAADAGLSRELEQPLNGIKYPINYSLLKYMYNAAFKGMLIDGGYRNNIPYNIFRREREKDQLKGVLAIKLDEHFPPDLMEKVNDKIKKYVEQEEQLYALNLPDDDPEIDALRLQLSKDYSKVLLEVEQIFAEYIMESDSKQQFKMNLKAIKRLINSAISHYRKKHLSPPWTQATSILNTAIDGYAYGSEKGQVQNISDHNHILPLYDYGVGTYDFDMKAVIPQIKMAQTEAEKKTLDFFK